MAEIQVRALAASTTYRNSIESDKLPQVHHDVSAELLDEPKMAITVRLLASDPMDALDQVNHMSRETALAMQVAERLTPGKDPHPAGDTPGYWSPNIELRPSSAT